MAHMGLSKKMRPTNVTRVHLMRTCYNYPELVCCLVVRTGMIANLGFIQNDAATQVSPNGEGGHIVLAIGAFYHPNKHSLNFSPGVIIVSVRTWIMPNSLGYTKST